MKPDRAYPLPWSAPCYRLAPIAKTRKESFPPTKPATKPRRSRLRKTARRPDLSIEAILAWADSYHERTGNWPRVDSGQIPETIADNWRSVDMCLRYGSRGLPRDSGLSLARLLEQRRGVRNLKTLPPLTEEQIVAWADEHRERTGEWPTANSGRIEACPSETWRGVHDALQRGGRGLARGSSLARLLDEARGVRNIHNLPPLTERQVLAWCDAHKHHTGDWPTKSSGQIAESPGDTWSGIDAALRNGSRGLTGRSSLAQFLARHRGRRNIKDLPKLSQRQIVAWARAHRERTGRWPTLHSGEIEAAPGETWMTVDGALRDGTRGLEGDSSLARLLEERCAKRNKSNLPKLTIRQILDWCDAHKRRTGEWPMQTSGKVVDSPEENWNAINAALQTGARGLRGGDSLAQLLSRRRGRRNVGRLPKLTYELILQWADAHRERTGRWPAPGSQEPIPESPGDCWMNINNALFHGHRGLPGGVSVARLLARRRKSSKSQS